MTGEFELREHTADVAVAATGDSLGAVFAAVADGLAAAMTDAVPAGGDRFEVSVTGPGREAALYDYLDELIYQRDVRDVLPVENDASVEERDGEVTVRASARGLPLAGLGAREVKAVTYSEMAVAETPEGWRAHVVFDV